MLQLLPIRNEVQTLECFNPENLTDSEEALIQLSWNEIRERAHTFAGEWAEVATFEEPVKAIKGKYHFIDLFWPGKMLVEY